MLEVRHHLRVRWVSNPAFLRGKINRPTWGPATHLSHHHPCLQRHCRHCILKLKPHPWRLAKMELKISKFHNIKQNEMQQSKNKWWISWKNPPKNQTSKSKLNNKEAQFTQYIHQATQHHQLASNQKSHPMKLAKSAPSPHLLLRGHKYTQPQGRESPKNNIKIYK